jgi:hypothetical protein
MAYSTHAPGITIAPVQDVASHAFCHWRLPSTLGCYIRSILQDKDLGCGLVLSVVPESKLHYSVQLSNINFIYLVGVVIYWWP